MHIYDVLIQFSVISYYSVSYCGYIKKKRFYFSAFPILSSYFYHRLKYYFSQSLGSFLFFFFLCSVHFHIVINIIIIICKQKQIRFLYQKHSIKNIKFYVCYFIVNICSLFFCFNMQIVNPTAIVFRIQRYCDCKQNILLQCICVLLE